MNIESCSQEQIEELFNRPIPVTKLAKEIGVSYNRLRAAFEKYNLKRPVNGVVKQEKELNNNCAICSKKTTNDKYCSRECSYKGFEKELLVLTKQCAICNILIKDNKTYCSSMCSNKAYSERSTQNIITCPNCSKERKVRNTEFNKIQKGTLSKFCNRKCSTDFRKSKTIIKTCLTCGNDFEVLERIDKQVKRKFCSSKCFGQSSEHQYRLIAMNKDESHKEAVKKTMLTRYGVDHPSKMQQNKLRQRNENNWSDIAKEVLDNKDKFVAYLNTFNEKPTMRELAVIFNCGYSTIVGVINTFNLKNFVKRSDSAAELEIQKWIKDTYNIDFYKTRQAIKPFEIDLYNDELKLGIEFNGDYWHSSLYKDAKYHQDKSLLAEKEGVFLFHIFEYEWNDPYKQQAIKSQIANLLGVNDRKVYARQCEIRNINAKEKSDFLNKNHRQGSDRSSIKLGLYYENELVSVMTFSRSRFTKKYEYELSRFASLSGTNVIGGGSKLFKHFVKNYDPTSVVSYSDIAKTKGGLYQKLGFVQSHVSPPNYVWTDFESYLTRYQTQMKNEAQTMTENGYVQIFDCGNKVWVWKS